MKQVSTCPSLFSRIYETNNAFYEGVELIKAEGIYSLDGSGSHYNIISKCLDLLELIFLYGESPHLKIETLYFDDWSRSNDYENMIISDYHFDERLENNPCWLLFYWDSQILGGLSPYTCVYTTPDVDLSELNLLGTNGNPLFGEKCVSLLKRGIAFKAYMIASILHSSKDSYSLEFKEFFRLCEHYIDEETKTEIKNCYLSNWHSIGTPFPNELCRDIYIANNHHISDYQIKSTVTQEGQDAPLLLTPQGMQGATYWREMKWNPNHMKVAEEPNPDITQRVLPGTADRYPYLTNDDLMEDKLIELTGLTLPDIDHFFFLHLSNRHFLIPIKSTFFNYFTASDLQQQVHILCKNDMIEVNLDIPLNSFKYRHNTIKKIYGKDDIINEDFFFFMTPKRAVEESHDQKNNFKIICSHSLDLLGSCSFTKTYGSNILRQGDNYVFLETETTPNVVKINGVNTSGVIIVQLERYYQRPSMVMFSVDCTTNDVAFAYSNDMTYSSQEILNGIEVEDTILTFEQDWKKRVPDTILRLIEYEFLPLLDTDPPLLFSYSYDEYCQRIGWMMRNMAIEKARTDLFSLHVVHDSMMPISQCYRLKESWEKSIASLENVVLVPSVSAIYSFLRRHHGICWGANTLCIELGEENTTISYNEQAYEKIYCIGQTLCSTAFFWGIHNDYTLSSDFVDEIILTYTKIYEHLNGSSNSEIDSVRETCESPFRFLRWLEKHSNDISHFWEYMRKQEIVQIRALVYFVSILYYINQLTKKENFKQIDKIVFCGPGIEILRLLGNNDVLSMFSQKFLCKLAGSSVTSEIHIMSSSNYKAHGGLDYDIVRPIIFDIKSKGDDEINYDEAIKLKDNCVNEVCNLVDILCSKHISRTVFDFFNIKTGNLSIIKELARDSFDYHIKDAVDRMTIAKEDLLFVPLMDYFSYSKGNAYSTEERHDVIVKEDRTSNITIYSERKIFISYKREELKQVQLIKEAIEKETGYKCWMDLQDIESGSEFTEDIVKAINNTNIFLFMLSENSQKSKFALKELRYAKRKEDRDKQRFVVLVNIDDCEMNDLFTFNFGELDTISYSDIDQRNKLFCNIKTWLSEL